MATTLTYPPQQTGDKLTCSKYSRGCWLNPALYCNTWVKHTETAAGKSRPFHLKLINSSSLKKQPPTSSPLVTVHSVIHRASFLFSEPRLAPAVMCAAMCVCHTLTSLLLIACWSDQSRSEAPLWAKQVTHGQGRCQHHRCCEFSRAKSVSLRWAVKLDTINPVQSGASRQSLLPQPVEQETTEFLHPGCWIGLVHCSFHNTAWMVFDLPTRVKADHN